MTGGDTQDTLVTCFFDGPPIAARRTGQPSPSPLQARENAQRILLRIADRRVTLLCGDVVTVGRNRMCDIVPSAAGEDDAEGRKRRLKVSRRHCELCRSSAGWFLRDGVADASGRRSLSSFGTWWNGVAVHDAHPLGDQAGILSLGGPSVADAIAFGVRRCGGALVLASRQPPCEVHVLLDGPVDLSSVDPALDRLVADWGNGRFTWRRGTESGVFVPGTSVQVGAGQLWVE